MNKAVAWFGAVVIGTVSLSGCSPEALSSLLGNTANPSAAAGSAIGKHLLDPAAEKTRDETFATYKAKAEAAAADPERTVKLFIAAYAQYKKDSDLAKELMTIFFHPDGGEVVSDPTSRSGYRIPSTKDYLWPALERNPDTALVHLTSPADADSANPEDSVVIDHDYAAVGKGVNGDDAKFYLAVNDGSGKRPRPVSLERTDGRWYVVEYSSIMVGI